jgi:hypothetical protein
MGYGLHIWGSTVLSKTSRPAHGPKQTPTQWLSDSVSKQVKSPLRKDDNLPASSVEIRNAYSYTSAPPSGTKEQSPF